VKPETIFSTDVNEKRGLYGMRNQRADEYTLRRFRRAKAGLK